MCCYLTLSSGSGSLSLSSALRFTPRASMLSLAPAAPWEEGQWCCYTLYQWQSCSEVTDFVKAKPFQTLVQRAGEREKDTCLSIFDHGSQGLSCFLKNTNTADSTKMTRWAWNSKQWQQVIQKQQYSAVVEINNNVQIFHFKNTNKWALRLFKQQVMWPKFYEIESNSQITQNPNWKSQEFMARELKNLICLCIKV